MAFNIKQNQRQPAPVDSTESELIIEDAPSVVATQSWVYGRLKKLWKWTKFFATESLNVAGGMKVDRIKTREMQSQDIFAHRLTLIDQEGRPCAIYIGRDGQLKFDYDFKSIFVYPGENQVKSFVYRYTDVVRNFLGLTPYSALMNFVPFKTNEFRTLNGKICYRLCAADSENANDPIQETLLFTCKGTKKIIGVNILDKDGEIVRGVEFPDISGKTLRKLTINMPCFKSIPQMGEEQETSYVALPGDYPIGNDSIMPFMPPFLLPPDCPLPPPSPVKPTSLSDDIFSEDILDENESLFENQPAISTPDEDGIDWDNPSTLDRDKQYEVVYEPYATSTYCNIVLTKGDFEPNKEQFLSVVTEDA